MRYNASVRLEIAWSISVDDTFGASEFAHESWQPVFATPSRVVGAVPRRRTILVLVWDGADWFCLDRRNGETVWTKRIWGPNSIEGVAEPDVIVATNTTPRDMGYGRTGTYAISAADGSLSWTYRETLRWIKDSRVGCFDQRVLDATTGRVVDRWDWSDEDHWCDTPEERLAREGVELEDPQGARVSVGREHVCRDSHGEVLWSRDLSTVCDLKSLRFVPPMFYGIAWRTDDGNKVTCRGYDALNVYNRLHGAIVTPIVIAFDARSGAVVGELPLPVQDRYCASWHARETRPIVHADALGLVVQVFGRIFSIPVMGT
jgi:outer membrane protein assembly factor BamB